MKQSIQILPVVVCLAAATMVPRADAASIIGINFARDGGGTHTGEADGLTNWTDVFDSDGFDGNQLTVLADSGSAVRASWAASNSWWAGDGGNSAQRIFACYLDDGQSNGTTALGGAASDGIGVRVQLSGLNSWLTAEGMTSYMITVYSSTDTEGATFQDVTVHQGGSTGAVLGTINVPVLGDNDYPSGPYDTSGAPRGSATLNTALSADIITLTLPVRNGTERGTLAAIKITAVPEPGVFAFLPLGLLALFTRKRR